MVGKPPAGGPAANGARPGGGAAAKSTATVKSTTVDGAEKAAFVCLYARRKRGRHRGNRDR